MEVTIDAPGPSGPLVVVVRGEIDTDTSPRLRAELRGAVDRAGHDVVLDLSEVSYMDSTGLGVLVACLKHARSRDGDLRVREASVAVRRVFDITGLTEVFQLGPAAEPAPSDQSGRGPRRTLHP